MYTIHPGDQFAKQSFLVAYKMCAHITRNKYPMKQGREFLQSELFEMRGMSSPNLICGETVVYSSFLNQFKNA